MRVSPIGPLGRDAEPHPHHCAIAECLTTRDAVVLTDEGWGCGTMVCLEIAKPYRRHADTGRRLTVVGTVEACCRLSKRDMAGLPCRPHHARALHRLRITFLSIDIDLMRWIEELSGSENGADAAKIARALSV